VINNATKPITSMNSGSTYSREMRSPSSFPEKVGIVDTIMKAMSSVYTSTMSSMSRLVRTPTKPRCSI